MKPIDHWNINHEYEQEQKAKAKAQLQARREAAGFTKGHLAKLYLFVAVVLFIAIFVMAPMYIV